LDPGILFVSTFFSNMMSSMSSVNGVFNEDDEIFEPISTVSIIAPGWYESDKNLEISLSSIANQNIIKAYPEYFELIFIGCVNVNESIPLEYGFKIICSPKGKLIARHTGILNAEGYIIVAVDCDTYYPPNWLNLMLKPYHEYDNVVATTCNTWQGILEPLLHNAIVFAYTTRISGRGSTFLKDAYFKVGGFNTNIDHSDIREIVREEEIGFRIRLQKIGKVVTVDAPIFHMGGVDENRGLRIYNG